jgi:glycosyltransferase involved in cell wall biosynthesis
VRVGPASAVVSFVIPCLDEETAIGPLVQALVGLGVDEVVVVDGGSADRTVDVAGDAGAKVVTESRRGYGRACATGVAVARSDATIIAFIDGDGSDHVELAASIVGPVMRGEADFVIGSRLRGEREPGSLKPPQVAAGHLAGLLMRALYRVRYTDMGPFRAISRPVLNNLGMREMTFGWNVEMQMRVAAARLRIAEVPVGCRNRIGGVSKVSGNLTATLLATWTLVGTVFRLCLALRYRPEGARPVRT